jgi:hypothetical protein
LRAATGLARLCREQHRIVEGRGILAPVYGSFTEGFELPDLAEARTLLQDLDPTDPVYRSSNPPTAHAIAR